MMNQHLKWKTLFWGAAKYSNLVISLVTTAVLSRLLTPSEYGIVSVTVAFTALFTVLTDLGYGTAVVQNRELTDEDINGIFSFSVYFSFLMAVLFALLGGPLSAFYGNPVYYKVCAVLSLQVLFTSLNTVPHAQIMRQKRFWNSGLRMLAAGVLSCLIPILMAKSGLSYYAIIFQTLIPPLVAFVWNVSTAGLRFRFRFRVESLRKVFSFTSYQFLYNLLRYFANNTDSLLIGKLMGSNLLAHYEKAHKLMTYPVQNITSYGLNPLLVPLLSEHQKDRQYIYRAYKKVLSPLSCIGVLVAAVLFWGSREAVLLFFGGQWTHAVPVFRLLSLAIWPQLLVTSASAIYQSVGDTRRMFGRAAVYFSTTIVLIVLGAATQNLQMVAVCVTLGQYLRFVIDYHGLIGKTLNASYVDFLKSFWFEGLYAAVMACLIALIPIEISSMLLSLFVKGCIALAVFLILGLPTGRVKQLLGLLTSRRKK